MLFTIMSYYCIRIFLKVLIITLFLLVYARTVANAEIRTFHVPEMCIPKQKAYDCSLQVPSHHTNSCLIYNTEVCKKNDYAAWNLKPLYKPLQESNSEFVVQILPYAAYIDDIQKDHPVSAINILLTSLNKNISGFSIIMTEDVHSRNICRIVDFRNSMDTINVPFPFFYDCFHYLTENNLQNVTMTFKAYPLNIELTYLVNIPRVFKVSDEFPNATCRWTPLLMIYAGSLSKNLIQLKFSNAPQYSEIVYFLVTLLDSSDKQIDHSRILFNPKNDMVASHFYSVETGFYSISISVVLLENSCANPVLTSGLFYVGPEIKDYSLLIFVILLIIMVISTCGLIYLLCQKYLKSAAGLSKPVILLVYFHKHLQHEFLVIYAKYLKKYYGVEVNLLYNRSGNPKEHLDEAISKSNIIVYVISEGLHQKFNQLNPTEEEDHHWVKQLLEAKALVDNLEAGTKKFCKICFPFSGKQHVPKCLEHRGPLFMLMGKTDESENFLCYIYNCTSKLSILNKMCCIKHHVVVNCNSMQDDYSCLREKLKDVISNKSDNGPNFYDKNVNIGNIQNVWEKKTNFKCKNEGGNYSKGNSVLDKDPNFSLVQDSKYKDGEELKKQSHSSDEENISTVFSVQDEEAQCTKNGYMRYCLRKMVNFEV